MLFCAFSTFFMKSMKKVEKAPKSKQGVFLMNMHVSSLQCTLGIILQTRAPVMLPSLWIFGFPGRDGELVNEILCCRVSKIVLDSLWLREFWA